MASFNGLPGYSSNQYSVKLKLQGKLILTKEDYFSLLEDVKSRLGSLPAMFSEDCDHYDYLRKKYGVDFSIEILNEKLRTYTNADL